MNTKSIPLTRNATLARAAFSPIRARRTTAPAATPPANILRFEPVEMNIPAWHRGPLDRLQPVLTRFRD